MNTVIVGLIVLSFLGWRQWRYTRVHRGALQLLSAQLVDAPDLGAATDRLAEAIAARGTSEWQDCQSRLHQQYRWSWCRTLLEASVVLVGVGLWLAR